MADKLKYIAFVDETTLQGVKKILGESLLFSVVASNRPNAAHLIGEGVLWQPPKTSKEYPLFVKAVTEAKPDVILCYSYSMKISEDILEVPKIAAVNIHGALLPKYRGANVLNWVLIKDETETGVTAHLMTDEIDAGDIVMQKTVPITDADTALTLKRKIDTIGMELVHKIYDDLANGVPFVAKPQTAELARVFPRRTPSDGFIDWSRPPREIFNLIRALVKPWPGAYYFGESGEKIVFEGYVPLKEVEALKEKFDA